MSKNFIEQGVVINGVRWATRNVGAPGTFVVNPEDFGNYFAWEKAKNACPRGWRLPTLAEFHSLNDTGSEWITRNGVSGRLFGSGRNQIFLPAAGMKRPVKSYGRVSDFGYHIRGGNIDFADWRGLYWSNDYKRSSFAWNLFFENDVSKVDSYLEDNGFNIRCVAID